jgi:two-component system, NarL family, sensor kinase
METDIIKTTEVVVLSFFISFFLSSITILLLFLYKKRQIQNKNKIEILHLQFQADVLKSNLEIQEETLHFIAREIHDNISLSLTLSKLYLNCIINAENDNNEPLISSAVDLISKSLYDLNNLSKSIDGEMIKKNGLLFSIENEVENIKKINKFKIEFDVFGEYNYLKPEIELLIFRIIQESLKNSITHSCAENIKIKMIFNDKIISIEISDDGKGFSTIVNEDKKTLSTGISSMKKRAALINSRFSIFSEIGKGTKINLEIPISNYV